MALTIKESRVKSPELAVACARAWAAQEVQCALCAAAWACPDQITAGASPGRIAKVGFGTKPALWILVWLRAHGSFPRFVLETPRRGRQKRKARLRTRPEVLYSL